MSWANLYLLFIGEEQITVAVPGGTQKQSMKASDFTLKSLLWCKGWLQFEESDFCLRNDLILRLTPVWRPTSVWRRWLYFGDWLQLEVTPTLVWRLSSLKNPTSVWKFTNLKTPISVWRLISLDSDLSLETDFSFRLQVEECFGWTVWL